MKTAPTRRNNFNLLRLILALLVILSHSPELADGNRSREILTRAFGTISFGEFAVDAFFLLSGYLIMQSWNFQPKAWPFLKKRVLRIYPGFLVASLVCALLVGPLGADPSGYFPKFDVAAFASSALLLQVPSVPDVFQGTSYPLVNGALWTISREFMCYLLVLVLGACGMLRRRHAWLVLTVITAVAFSLMKFKAADVPDALRLGLFFLSGGSFFIYRDTIRMDGRLALVFLVPLLIGLCSWRGAELALATFGAYVLLHFAQHRTPVLTNFNRVPDISYGVYLYGWPVQKLLFWYTPSLSPWTVFAVASAIAIALGYLSWHFVEEPMLKLKGKSSSPIEATSAAVTT